MLKFIEQALNIVRLTTKKTTKCKTCGKEFSVRFDKKISQFCSNKCSQQRPSYIYTCDYCQNQFTRRSLSHRVNNFCCERCRKAYNNNKSIIKNVDSQ